MDEAALCKRLMRPGDDGHLFFSALSFGQWNKPLSRAREKKDSNSHVGKGLVTSDGEVKKAVFEPEIFLFHYTREVGTIMTRTVIRKTHHVNFC